MVNLSYDPVGEKYVATFKDRLFQSDTPGTYDRSAFISTSTDLCTGYRKPLRWPVMYQIKLKFYLTGASLYSYWFTGK